MRRMYRIEGTYKRGYDIVYNSKDGSRNVLGHYSKRYEAELELDKYNPKSYNELTYAQREYIIERLDDLVATTYLAVHDANKDKGIRWCKLRVARVLKNILKEVMNN